MKFLWLAIAWSSLCAPVALRSDTWNPVPPAQIPASTGAGSIVYPAYNGVLDEYLTVWLDGAFQLPTYAIYDGTSWSGPAVVPGSGPGHYAALAAGSTASNQFLVTWVDAVADDPYWALFNGTSWTGVAQIPGSGPVAFATAPFASFGAGAFLVTWLDRTTTLPYYALFDGTSWTAPAPISGSSVAQVNASIFSTYGLSGGGFLVTWMDGGSLLPYYAIFDGMVWTTPGPIPGSSVLGSSNIVMPAFNSVTGQFLVTWIDGATGLPYYANYTGGSWSTPDAIPGGVPTLILVDASFDAASQLFLVTWPDATTHEGYYATYDGAVWSTPAIIPGSSPLGLPTFSSASPGLFLVTWPDGDFVPTYSTFAPTVPPAVLIEGFASSNRSILQKELLNVVRWSAPMGLPYTPVSYRVYRNVALTDLAATVPASGPLAFVDHNRERDTLYTYYVVAVDEMNVQHLLGTVSVVSLS